MKHYDETIEKFLSTLEVDSTNDVKYICKTNKTPYCICGQYIKKGYIFCNIKNNKVCVVGKNCLNYVAYYLNWK